MNNMTQYLQPPKSHWRNKSVPNLDQSSISIRNPTWDEIKDAKETTNKLYYDAKHR